MALNEQQLTAMLNEALRQADIESAPESLKEAKGKQTKQRLALAKAIAEQVIKHIKEQAEVIVPDHDPFRTDIASGAGAHAHPVLVPLRHKHGKII